MKRRKVALFGNGFLIKHNIINKLKSIFYESTKVFKTVFL